MTDMSCDDVRLLVPELALGALDGRERAEALAHLEHCEECRRDLLAMSEVADRLVELTPPAEPPAGFETRVLAALGARGGAESVAQRQPRVRRRPPRGVTVLATAAIVAVVFGIGGWALGRHSAPTRSSPSRVETAALVTGGRPVGQVIAVNNGYPWISMAVESALGDTTVRCEVIETGHRAITVGSFALDNGYGYWSAPVPPSASPITGARLVDASGHTVATATFSPTS